MKLKIIAIITVSFLCLAFVVPGTIAGKITFEKKYPLHNPNLIQLKGKDSILAYAEIFDNDSFNIPLDFSGEADLYFMGNLEKPLYLATLKSTEKITQPLIFKLPKVYHKKAGTIICPKCNKNDQTIPIQYGFGVKIIYRHVTADGDTILTNPEETLYHDGGCSESEFSAKWYCKRDYLEF